MKSISADGLTLTVREADTVIATIGAGEDFEIVHHGPQAEELALSLREELTGIQYGRLEDRHGWMVRLDA